MILAALLTGQKYSRIKAHCPFGGRVSAGSRCLFGSRASPCRRSAACSRGAVSGRACLCGRGAVSGRACLCGRGAVGGRSGSEHERGIMGWLCSFRIELLFQRE